MTFRFVFGSSFFGPASDGVMSTLVREQFLAVMKDGGDPATSMRAYCDAVAVEMDQSPDLAGFELWDVREGEATAPRFTLFYFPDADSGLLLHAGTATPVGLALWQDGFKPKPEDAIVTGIDIQALTDACANR